MKTGLTLAVCAVFLAGCQSDQTLNWTAVGALGGLAVGAASGDDAADFTAIGGAAGYAVETDQRANRCAVGECPPLDDSVAPPAPQTTQDREQEARRREVLSGKDGPAD